MAPVRPTRRRLRLAFAAGTVALAAGCAGSSGTSSSAGAASPSAAVSGTITVSAAASLTGAFTSLAGSFQRAHPGVHVRLGFGGSDALAAQITQGAPVDVFAAASTTTMSMVTKAGDAAGTPTVFVRNELEIATPKGNPRHITTLAQATRPGVKLALCAPQVPCGAAAQKALQAAHLRAHPVTLELDVKGVLTKVALGEVDAGIVYRTDVQAAAGKVTGVTFPEAAQAINNYPIVTLKGSKNPATAAAFVSYVLGPTGRRVLTAAGFRQP